MKIFVLEMFPDERREVHTNTYWLHVIGREPLICSWISNWTGSFSQITKIVFQSVFLKDVLSEKQAPSFSDCRSVFSSVACLASVVSFATPPSQHHRKAICTFFFSAVISFVFLCSATTINGKFNRALPALADTGTNKTVTSRFEPPSLSGRPSFHCWANPVCIFGITANVRALISGLNHHNR